MLECMISSGKKAHPVKHPRFDCAEQEGYLNLWRTYDRLRFLEDQLFQRHGITAQQYNAMRLLRAAHPKRMQTLNVATKLISRAPDITRLLDRLVERGLVDRERPADNRRVVLVGITQAGLDLLEELAGQVIECNRQQLAHLKPEEMKELVKLLKRARQPHETEGGDWA
jgi:DNA-binding MarR family transcriptional regulator